MTFILELLPKGQQRENHIFIRSVRFAIQLGQSGTFPYQISVYFGSPSQSVLKSDLKKSHIVTLGTRLIHFVPKYNVTGLFQL